MGGGGRPQIVTDLLAGTTYILVTTTFSPNVVGGYNDQIEGVGQAALGASNITFDCTITPTATGTLPSGGNTAYFDGGSVSIPDSGAGDPYPATVDVSGLGGVVTDVNVTVFGISHTSLADVNIMLVSPDGTSVSLLQNACGGVIYTNMTVEFDDQAAGYLANGDVCFSGTYRPTSYGTTTYPPPAPSVPDNFNLDAFNGIDPNGEWDFYVYDSASGDSGSIAGFTLAITVDGFVNPTPTPTATIPSGGNTSYYDGEPITIPDSGPGIPYPAVIDVSGLGGVVTDVNLTLTGITHTFLADVNALLVSPDGTAVALI